MCHQLRTFHNAQQTVEYVTPTLVFKSGKEKKKTFGFRIITFLVKMFRMLKLLVQLQNQLHVGGKGGNVCVFLA